MTDILDRLQNAIADRYVIQREVGRGGMANVYLAHDVRHDRAVAVKVLRPELGVLLGAERFLREIRVVARLQHPHILPVHDSGEVDGALFYVMPYVEGASLRERLRKERWLQLNEAVRIACDVAGALDLAHRRGVVHRDIKPGNILFVDGHAVVADFGIARAVHAAGGEMWETITDSGVALGTPAYMSPEQAVGAATLDARADIYSLGCVLYEMLVGEPPFIGPGGEVLVAKRFAEDPPLVSTLRPDVPHEVDEAVARALARNPDDRYASAREFMDTLSVVGSTDQTVAHRPRRPASRSVALAFASAGVALAAMFFWMAQRPTTNRAPVADTSATTSISEPPPLQPAGEAVTGQPAVTPGVADTSVSRPQSDPTASNGPVDTVRPGPTAGRPSVTTRTPAPAEAAARPERLRLDSVFQSVAAGARDARRRAVLAGALPADLARGDSLVANARALADRGRWSDAIERMSSVTVTWIEAQQTADARRVADSEAARTPTVQAPPPPPPSAPAARATARETTAVPPADPRVEIAAVLARYARALESRNLAELQGAYPGLTATQRQSWERFFRDVQEMRTSLTIDDLEVRGDAAAARVSGQYRYTAGSGGRQETQPVSFHATFRREGGAWRLAAVTQ